MLQNKTVLITGGTGSFGSELFKFLYALRPKEIRILSRDKLKQEEFAQHIPVLTNVKFFLGDISDKSIVNEAIKGCDFIFHAAALKDVSYCEQHPLEALAVNVYGTNNIIESAIEHKVKKVVVVSTDKAVAPAGTMGITKAMMERVVIAKTIEAKQSATKFVIIRFGNLMGSSGTVVPLFIKQVKEGKKLTVTNPQMTRFMMTLSQAAEYALFALEKGNNGDIIIRNSPALSIGNLARAVIELYDKNSKDEEYDSSSQIIVTGSRPGERLFEIMASEQEMLKAEQIEDSIYLRIPALTSPVKVSNSYTINAKKLSGYSPGLDNLTQPKELNSSNMGELNIEEIKSLINK
ncbi:MAG: hypothetical protein A2X19_07305 [Bacteroidetes bacterium GWE2_39_28]|nr:MAG: hypothetical protein A2X19_07305 [Bacteroidetes bacterium GWE2_39_28]OFY12696.1 MAG: hypothetical protein A2X16_03075 [Bacteroidetes bacterium GWF2_39_10]OFZ08236.1 MAG: hypothetical protein A2322_03715 [Bacteroidetes bacterium RIFOXYB2_FULL_39_7]OFZ10152.1 MAG: hypothetical protein A2465_10305 [Bacteroidetes bacterium RIFOXYC2_FULL_39_11]HCT94588.1 UDP-glucose 4-epimerase [Rikenellaceae bacterium]